MSSNTAARALRGLMSAMGRHGSQMVWEESWVPDDEEREALIHVLISRRMHSTVAVDGDTAWYLMHQPEGWGSTVVAQHAFSEWLRLWSQREAQLGQKIWLSPASAWQLWSHETQIPRQIVFHAQGPFRKVLVIQTTLGLRAMILPSDDVPPDISVSRDPAFLGCPAASWAWMIQRMPSTIPQDDLNLLASVHGVSLPVATPLINKEPHVSALDAARLRNPAARRIAAAWKDFSEQLAGAEVWQRLAVLGEGLRASASGLDLVDRAAALSDQDAESWSLFASDAYNSLSIEGFKVTVGMMESLKFDGSQQPAFSEAMSLQRSGDSSAIARAAALGYRCAFESVMKRVNAAHAENLGEPVDWVAEALHTRRELFKGLEPEGAPLIRDHPIFIKGATHVPVADRNVRFCLDQWGVCMTQEDNPWTRAMLGHLFLAYIHPFADGNGRTARFMMNSAMLRAGLPWVVTPEAEKSRYFAALDAASSRSDIQPMADLFGPLFEVAIIRRQQHRLQSSRRKMRGG